MEVMNRREAVLYTLKYTWKRALIGAAVIVAMAGTMAVYGSRPFGGSGTVLAAPRLDSPHQIAATEQVTPNGMRARDNAPGAEHGWGPFRLVDW
jgi:hypothetical protein